MNIKKFSLEPESFCFFFYEYVEIVYYHVSSSNAFAIAYVKKRLSRFMMHSMDIYHMDR